jgi:hypothetical protein
MASLFKQYIASNTTVINSIAKKIYCLQPSPVKGFIVLLHVFSKKYFVAIKTSLSLRPAFKKKR